MLTPEQIEMRRTGIGGSDIAPIMGKSPYLSALDIYYLKRDLVEVPQTEAMYWGDALESAILARYAKDHPHATVKTGMGTLRGAGDMAWCLTTPDAWSLPVQLGVAHGIEAKTAHAFAAHDWQDGPPLHYVMQCQWYMGVLATPRWDIAVLLGGSDYREFILEADETMFAEMLEAARHFWFEHVQKEIPPEPTTAAEVVALHPHDDGRILRANGEQEDTIIAFRKAYRLASRVGQRVDTLKAAVQAIIGDASGIEGPWGRITWKASGKSRRFICNFNEE